MQEVAMKAIQFIRRSISLSLMALAAWLLSPSVQADDTSTKSVPFSQKEEMKQDTIKPDLTEDQLQIQRDAQRRGEVSQKESERRMR